MAYPEDLMLSLAFALIASTTTTGSGVVTAQTRPLAAFHAVKIQGSFAVELVKGEIVHAQVTGDDNIVPLIVTEVKDGVLTIESKDGASYDSKLGVIVKVTAAALDDVSARGSGSVSVVDVATPVCALSNSGSGALSFRGVADALTLTSSGSGAVTLVGSAKSLAATQAGSGAVDAGTLTVADATVALRGSGRMVVNASARLTASVMGSGQLLYLGTPQLTKTVRGSGSVAPKS